MNICRFLNVFKLSNVNNTFGIIFVFIYSTLSDIDSFLLRFLSILMDSTYKKKKQLGLLFLRHDMDETGKFWSYIEGMLLEYSHFFAEMHAW